MKWWYGRNQPWIVTSWKMCSAFSRSMTLIALLKAWTGSSPSLKRAEPNWLRTTLYSA